MRGVSRVSMAEAEERIESRLRDAESSRVLGVELLEVTTTLISSTSLRRALTDSARAVEERAGLSSSLFASRIGSDASEVVTGLVMSRWAKPRDLAEVTETLGVTALAASAQMHSRLNSVEDDLFRFSRVLRANYELQRAVSSVDAPTESKVELVTTLVGGKIADEALTLIIQAATHPRGGLTLATLENYCAILAARRERDVAYVTTARELTDEQFNRLADSLARTYDRALVLNVQIDPDLLGGVKVQVGDEVLDGSVASRIEDLRRRLAG